MGYSTGTPADPRTHKVPEITEEQRRKARWAICGARATKDAKDAIFLMEILGLKDG